jgi:MFS family permease
MRFLINKNYALLMGGVLSSAFGSFCFNFAFMAYLYEMGNGDKSYIAYSQIVFIIGLLLGNLAGGPVGEHFNRKKIVFLCEALRIPFVFLMYCYSDLLWPLIGLHGLKTFFGGLSTPVKKALITDIVPTEKLDQANTMFIISYALIQIFAPFFGTWIYSHFNNLKEVLLLDLSTFIFATVLLFFITSYKKPLSRPISFLKEIRDGFSYVGSKKNLVALYERHLITGLVVGLLIPLVLPFTSTVLGKGDREYGILMLCFGLGGAVFGILSKKFINTFGHGKIIIATCALEPFIMLVWSLTSYYYLSLFIFFIWGGLFFLRAPIVIGYLTMSVDREYLSRSHSLLDFSFTIMNLIGAVTIGILSKVETQKILIIASVSYLIYGLFRIRHEGVKLMLNKDLKSE